MRPQSETDWTGQRIGEHHLERRLGHGGMSVVWFARHVATGQPAAVKILNQGLPANIEAERRLAQEARAIQRIEHPNVVRVLEWGQTPPPQPRPYLTLEFIEGVPLSSLIGRGRLLAPARLIPIALQVLGALDQAHALDIIHRDIKPDNILLTSRDGQRDFVKMLDFGIAKLRGTQPHTAIDTQRGIVLGTPEYLPPEVALDQGVGPESDLYALGCVLFEALTGRLPFQGRTAMALAEAHCFSPVPKPRSFNPELDPQLEAVVLRCLAKQPRERFRNASGLAEALAACLAPTEVGAATVVTSPIPARPTPESDGATLDEQVRLLETRLRAVLDGQWQSRTLPGPVARSLDRVAHLRRALDELEAELALHGDGGTLALDVTRDDSDFFREELSQAQADERRAAAALAALEAEDATLAGRLHGLEGGALSLLLSTLDGGGSLADLLEGPVLDTLGARLKREEAVRSTERSREVLQGRLEAAAEALAIARSHRVQLEADRAVAEAMGELGVIRQRARLRSLQVRREALQRRRGEALVQLFVDLALAAG